jgi:hypothetical protein
MKKKIDNKLIEFLKNNNKSNKLTRKMTKFSRKKNFDHLNLRNEVNYITFKKVSALIKSKGEEIISSSVFSDFIHQIDKNMKKTELIILISDESLYLMQVSDYKIMYHVKLAYLTRVVSIVDNSNIFAVNFAGIDIKPNGQ